ncbi:hypothetical protein PITCH_A780093 [uncultured Desulfobacterium sp.]|uniref:Uncharacterized protein n=1 Tax=uncultured Desulfobacterium sp. TaxID=201089 RepID=A0A445N2P5_9BACT|nr:hypothetical protein PITCH_A780093 [uncultured Desulfobacterium sp.]
MWHKEKLQIHFFPSIILGSNILRTAQSFMKREYNAVRDVSSVFSRDSEKENSQSNDLP